MSLERAAKHDFENFLAKADFFLSVVLPDEKLSPNTEECRKQVVDAMNSLKRRDSLKIAVEEIQENPGSVEDGTGMGIPHLDDGILTENNNMEEWVTRYKYREPISDGTHLSTGIFPGKDRGDLDTDQSTGNNGKLIQAEDNSTQDTLVGAKGNSSTNKEHKGTASVTFSNQAITSHCEEEDTFTDCTSEKSSGKGILESEEESKILHGDSLCDGSKNSESDCSQRLLNPQGNYPNSAPEADSNVVTCDSTYSFKDTVKSCEKQNVPEDKGNFQEDQSVLPHTATKNLTAAADEVPPESRKYISVKSLKLSYSDLPKSEDQSQKEKIHPRRNSSGDFEDSESLSGTWSSWSDIDSRRGSSLPRTSFQAFARQISTSSEYSLPETPFPTTSRQNSDFDFDSVLSVRDRSKSLGHVPRFVTIQLQDLTKKRIKVSKMQRRASLSQNLWQVLSENASEDSPLLDSSVSSSDLKKPYHSGWLMSPYDGKRYWCIVADILLCMFDQPTSPRAYKVLVLPGYEIRPIILVSEDENTSHNSQQLQTQDFCQDTGKYQVKLTHQNAGTEFTLCVESQKELHKWTEALRLAASLDHSISTDTDDEESSDDDTGYYSNYSYYNNNSVFPGLKYRLPSTGSGSGQRMHTDSFNSEENSYYFSKDFLVKDDSSNLGSEFARSSPPILSDLIRVQQSDNVSTSSSTKSSPCSTLERDLDLIDVVDKVPEEADKKAKHERSASEPSRRSFGMKLAKQATKMKERMSLKTTKTKGNVPQDVTLGSLSKAKHSGELELKMKTGWAKYWCVICNKNLYLFKSSQSDEMAEMILPLSGCQASKSQREKLPNVLKISHPAYKRVYLQASQHADLLKWVDFINREGSPLASSASDSHIKWGGKHKDKDTPINKSNSFASLQRRFGSSHEKKANGKESKENCSPTTQRRMAMLRMSRASFLEGYDGIDDGNDNETEEQSIQDLESNMDSDVFSLSVPSVLRPCYSEDESNGSLSEMESVYSLRKKSLHGSLDDIPGLNLNGKKSKKEKKSKKKMHPISVVHTAAKEWTKASKIGYLNRKCKGPWTRYWAVLNKDTLYLYKTPEDTATVDAMALPGYKVSTDVKTAFKSRKLTFKLVHEGERSTYFSAETESDFHEWIFMIDKASQKITVEGLNLETGVSSEFDETQAKGKEVLKKENQQDFQRELVKLQKKRLLQELLARNTGIVHKEQRPKSMPPMSFPATKEEIDQKYEKSVEEEETKALKYQTLLKRRRMSAQIKVDDLQKKMQEEKRKGVCLSEEEYAAMEKRLQDLNNTLKKVESDIAENKSHQTNMLESLKEKKELELKIVAQQHRMKQYRKVAAEKALQEISETVAQVSPMASEQITSQVTRRQTVSGQQMKRRTLPVIPAERSPIMIRKSLISDLDSESFSDKSTFRHSFPGHSNIIEKAVSSGNGDLSLTLTSKLSSKQTESSNQSSSESHVSLEETTHQESTTVAETNVCTSQAEEVTQTAENSQTPKKDKPPIRTEVSAETLAEIEAFEKLSMEMLGHYGF